MATLFCLVPFYFISYTLKNNTPLLLEFPPLQGDPMYHPPKVQLNAEKQFSLVLITCRWKGMKNIQYFIWKLQNTTKDWKS